MLTFWLDADVYIQAKNGPYKFERLPQFWSFLAEQFDAGNIKSPKRVYDEITEGSDLLASWARRQRQRMCAKADKSVQACFRQITNHVYTKYKPHQASEFLRGGDGWVIAHAMATGGVVVTHESERGKKARVKVPTVCREFNVKCINTYAMLDKLDFKVL